MGSSLNSYIPAKAIPTGIPLLASITTPYTISAQVAQDMQYYVLHNFSNLTSAHVQYGGFAVCCKSIAVSLAN